MQEGRCIIPPNFALDGVATGEIKWRNLIEAGIIIFIVGYPLLFLNPMSWSVKKYLGIMILLPLIVLAIKGIDNMCLSVYLFYFIKALMNRRILTYPDAKANIQREKKLLRKKRRKLQEIKKSEKREKWMLMKNLRAEKKIFDAESKGDL